MERSFTTELSEPKTHTNPWLKSIVSIIMYMLIMAKHCTVTPFIHNKPIKLFTQDKLHIMDAESSWLISSQLKFVHCD